MFGIGLSHILLVSVIALIFIGPEELPRVIRTLGKFMGQLKRSTDELTGMWHSVTNDSKDFIHEERKQFRESIYETPPAARQSTSAIPASAKLPPPTVGSPPAPASVDHPAIHAEVLNALEEKSDESGSGQLTLNIDSPHFEKSNRGEP